jgi:hypothetical protein
LTQPISVLTADGSLLPLFETRTLLPAQAAIRIRAEGAGVYCPLVEGIHVADGYLGAGRLPGAHGEVEVAAGIDAQGLLDLRLSDADLESQMRLALRGIDPGLEATAYAQRALPGEPEVWTFPTPKAAPPGEHIQRHDSRSIRLPPRAPLAPPKKVHGIPPPRKR